MQSYQDYTKEPRSAYQFDLWKKASPIVTPLGNYQCELLLDFDVVPDESLIALADEASAFLKSEHSLIASILLAHLHRCAKDWGDELVFTDEPIEGEPIPRDVSGERLFQIYGGGSIQVSRFGDDNEVIVSFEVPFDPEHGLRLALVDGRFTTLNDSEFTVENGQLKYDWD